MKAAGSCLWEEVWGFPGPKEAESLDEETEVLFGSMEGVLRRCCQHQGPHCTTLGYHSQRSTISVVPQGWYNVAELIKPPSLGVTVPVLLTGQAVYSIGLSSGYKNS